MNPKIVAIIQARQGSTRLPGKVMMEVFGKPLIGHLIERVARAKYIQEIVIATTLLPIDDVIGSYCQKNRVSCFRGSEGDVLGRYFEAAKMSGADAIVRITGDCPLMDPEVVDEVVERYLEAYPKIDYAANILQRTYPRGMDVEVFSYKVLTNLAETVNSAVEREHVTLHITHNPQLFSRISVVNSDDQSHYRLTVDTKEDFELVKKLIEALYPAESNFTLKRIVEMLNQHPDWEKINAHIEQKKV